MKDGEQGFMWSKQGFMSSKQGFALLTVLWGMAVLAVLVAAILALAESRGRHAHNLAEAAKAEALADGGARLAINQLRRLVKDPLWRADGRATMVPLEDGEIEWRASDEAGRIDLNFAEEELLRALLLGAGADERQADGLKDAIQDWIDRDDLRRLNGAEAAEYRAVHRPEPGNRPFALIDELRLVKGMTPQLFHRLAPFVTVHSRQRGLDADVAPPQLRAMLPEALPPQFTTVTRRQIFTIRATGRTPAGAVFVRDCVVRLMRDPANPFQILAWRKGRPDEELR